MNRRKFLELGAAGSVASIAGCLGGAQSGETNGNLRDMDYSLLSAKFTNPLFFTGANEGVWEESGINLEVSINSTERDFQALQNEEVNVNDINQSTFINAIEAGEDHVLVAPHEKLVNGVFVREDSDIESPEDLEGRSVGVPFWDSGTTYLIGSMFDQEYDIDLREDVDATSANPSVLWEALVEQEDLDAILQFTNYTIRGRADDSVREIFDPAEWWREETGEMALITYKAVRREWIEEPENAQLIVDFLEGWGNTIDTFLESPEEYMDRFGELGGFSTEAETNLTTDIFRDGALPEPESWDEDYIDNQFEMMDMIGESGFVDNVPDPAETTMTHSDILEIANNN